MIVAELIKLLQSFDPNIPVVTGGFDESCLDDISTVELRTVKFGVRSGGLHCGPHEESPEGIPAVVIDF